MVIKKRILIFATTVIACMLFLKVVNFFVLLAEPMLTMGSIHPIIWDDDWTVVTEDGSLSAQFEHTLLITENGAEILTQC